MSVPALTTTITSSETREGAESSQAGNDTDKAIQEWLNRFRDECQEKKREYLARSIVRSHIGGQSNT